MDVLHACDIVYCLEWAASRVCAYVLPAETTQIEDNSDAKKNIHSHVITYKFLLIAADR